MFIIASLIAICAIPTMVLGRPAHGIAETDVSQCNAGTLQCCQSVQSSNSPAAVNVLAGLGVALPVVTNVGLTCNPILPVASNSCVQQPVCCTGNSFNGVLVVGCSPISL